MFNRACANDESRIIPARRNRFWVHPSARANDLGGELDLSVIERELHRLRECEISAGIFPVCRYFDFCRPNRVLALYVECGSPTDRNFDLLRIPARRSGRQAGYQNYVIRFLRFQEHFHIRRSRRLYSVLDAG